jgi:two-component system, response regulator PdtaR
MGCSESQFASALSSDGKGLGRPGGFWTGDAFQRGHFRSCDVDDVTNGNPAARTVLIVEDNALLKLFAVNLVEAAGFTAIDASNADEAVSILENRTDIALLVTNVVMRGGMDGVELAHTVHNRWPAVKTIVVSGRAGLSEHDLPPTTLLVSKPYHDEELIFEIRSLMDPYMEAEPRWPYLTTAIQ